VRGVGVRRVRVGVRVRGVRGVGLGGLGSEGSPSTFNLNP